MRAELIYKVEYVVLLLLSLFAILLYSGVYPNDSPKYFGFIAYL